MILACYQEPTAAVTLMITSLAATAGHRVGTVVLIRVAVLTGQLSIGWLNDAVDADRDDAVGRTDKPIATGAPFTSELTLPGSCGGRPTSRPVCCPGRRSCCWAR